MKIVYISSSSIPSRAANSIHVMKMCQAISKNGHEVVLLAPDDKDHYEPGVENVFDYYGVEQCFEIIKLPWVKLRGRGYIYGGLAALKSCQLKPDLVFGRNTVGCTFSAFMGLPVIFESHTPVTEDSRLGSWLFARLANHPGLKKLVVITHLLKEHYLFNHPYLESKIHVAPDGADPIESDIDPLVPKNAGTRLQVGYVGHLYKGKGMELVAQLARSCPWADFHVVGGKEADIVFWKDKTCGPNITFHGYLPHSKVATALKAFDVVLLPNQKVVSAHGGGHVDIGKWTSPLKAFEYMAAKKPIIGSDLPVLREVLKDGKNALLCDPENILAWQKALRRLMDETDLADRLAKTAYDEFRKSYTWQARAAKILIGGQLQ